MANKPKATQYVTGKVIKPKNDTTKGRVLDRDAVRKEQLKKNKKPSKGGTGYRNYGSA